MISYLKLVYYLLRPRTLFLRRTSNGLGDNLLLTAVLPELRRQNPNHKIIVETPWKELFRYNPNADWVTDRHLKTTERHLKPKYHVDEGSTVSIYEQIMGHVGVSDRGYPELYLTEEETAEAKGRYGLPYITVCPTGKTTFCANRKEWGVDNFQALRDLLGDYRFVQVGLASDPLLDRVIDGRDLDVRQTAATIGASLFFIGLEGGLMHLARAVNQRAVIIYGGFIRPEISAYRENLSIYVQVECSPCFHSDYVHEPCATMACMKMISPEMVYDRITSEFLVHTEAEA